MKPKITRVTSKTRSPVYITKAVDKCSSTLEPQVKKIRQDLDVKTIRNPMKCGVAGSAQVSSKLNNETASVSINYICFVFIFIISTIFLLYLLTGNLIFISSQSVTIQIIHLTLLYVSPAWIRLQLTSTPIRR